MTIDLTDDKEWDWEEFYQEWEELEKEQAQFEKEMEQIDKEMEYLFLSMDLLENLSSSIVDVNKKIMLLKTLKHSKIREQFLIDLFLAELVSIFEGFIFNYFSMFNDYLKIIEHDAKEVHSFLNTLNYKVTKSLERNLNGLLNEKSKKTLNNPEELRNFFTKVFKLDFDVPYTSTITKSFLRDCITIRNAHIHKNGIHKKQPPTLEQVNELLVFYVSFLNNLNSALVIKMNAAIPKTPD